MYLSHIFSSQPPPLLPVFALSLVILLSPMVLFELLANEKEEVVKDAVTSVPPGSTCLPRFYPF